jgi:hypothetical protein
MCDVNSGKFIETETEVSSVNSLVFKSKMIVIEDDAKTITLKAYPGVSKRLKTTAMQRMNLILLRTKALKQR